jgi:hypothetical protein
MTHEICDPPSDRSRGGRDGTRAQSKVRSPMSKVEKAGRDSVGPGPVRTLLIDGTGHRRNGIGRDGMAGVRGRRAGTKRDLLVVGIRFHIRGSQIPTKLGRVIEVGTGHAVLSSESGQNPSDRRRQGRSGLPLAGTGHGTGTGLGELSRPDCKLDRAHGTRDWDGTRCFIERISTNSSPTSIVRLPGTGRDRLGRDWIGTGHDVSGVRAGRTLAGRRG